MLGPAVLVTGMRGGYRARCIRATWRNAVARSTWQQACIPPMVGSGFGQTRRGAYEPVERDGSLGDEVGQEIDEVGEEIMERFFAGAGAVAAMIGVIVGAFGAHGLESRVTPADLDIFETGVRYHMYHALGLFAVAWAASRWPSGATTLAGWLLIVGIVVFSGSLYTLVLTGQRWLGAVTPLGGLCFMAGWLCLALAAWRQ